ncbi:MAG: hypothetical protein LBE91_21790 [Tannerella sp.]|jgi:hypothetical protein|nr:hypothetical protein [Tannerella sp.]
MKRNNLIVLMVLVSMLPFCAGAQEKASDVLKMYRGNGAVSKKDNHVGLKVDEISFEGNGRYVIDLDFEASQVEGNYMPLDITKAPEILVPKLYVFNAVSPGEEIPAQSEKLIFLTSSGDLFASFGTSPIQGFGAKVTVETDRKFILLCFEGVSNDELRNMETPPMFFMIELNGKKSKVLDKKPYYMGD